MLRNDISRFRRLAALAACACVVLPCAVGATEDYPNRPIRIVVPFSPGGSSDLQARLLADRLSKHYGQSVVVENKPGAGGHIGGKFVASAEADGYTLLFGSIGLHATYNTYPKLGYDPSRELKVITVVAEMPHVLVVSPNVQAGSPQDLVAFAKRDNGMTFGSAGVGSSVHMIGELFRQESGAKLVHVPYRGSAPALVDLLGGQIDLMLENPPTVLDYVKNGKLRALAVTGAERLAALPEVPTLAQAGYPGATATSWTTVAVGAGVADAIADRLNADIRAIAASADFQDAMRKQGMTPVAAPRAQSVQFIRKEKARWDRVIDNFAQNAK